MKKTFISRRSITMVDGKPHVEIYSEQELVMCKDCKYRDPENHHCDCGTHEWVYGKVIPVADDFFCAHGEPKRI